MNIDLIALAQHLGMTRSAYSENQLTSDRHSIKITGEKWYDHDAKIGGGGAIDLLMHLQGLDYSTARSYLEALPELTATPPEARKTASEVIGTLGLKKAGVSVFESDDHRITVNGELWNCHKCDRGGKGAINLVMHVDGGNYASAKDFLESDAVRTAIATNEEKPAPTPTTPPKSDKSTLPVVISYLCQNRGLNRVMVEWCVNRGLIYSDYKANACFKYGAGVAMRGTGSVGFRANRGTLTECFTLPAKGSCEGVAVLESAIDALSYRQMNPTITACAIAGNGNGTLMRYALDMAAKQGVIVVSAFDSDKGGNEGHSRLIALNSGLCAIYEHRPPQGVKDWNDYLNKQ